MVPDVLVCSACSHRLSRPVVRVGRVPERRHADEDGVGYLPTMTPGTWAVDTDARLHRLDGTPVDAPGSPVLHPEDGLGLETHPDRRRSAGCCGDDGCDGPNRCCPRCHAEVATLSDDCWTYVELRFSPVAVRVVVAA